MCGIIGYTGSEDVREVLLDALELLEYRGYDSAGIALRDEESGKTEVRKCAGRVSDLRAICASEKVVSQCGIGHTRWATHGGVNDCNAHPHQVGKVTLVHNGIIENYRELIADYDLADTLKSETDSEVVAALLNRFYEGNPEEAIKKTVSKLKGTFALVILFEDQKDVIYSTRNVSPIVATICKEGAMLASDLTALCRFTNRYFVVPEYHILKLSADKLTLTDFDGNEVLPKYLTVDWELNSAGKNGYPFYMEKEIMEQPEAIENTIRNRIVGGMPDFTADGVPDTLFTECEHICIVACGTAMHAGLVAQALVKSILHMHIEVQMASEFMYSDPVIDEKTLVIAVSQSGDDRYVRGGEVCEEPRGKVSCDHQRQGFLHCKRERLCALHQCGTGDRGGKYQGVHDTACGILSDRGAYGAQQRCLRRRADPELCAGAAADTGGHEEGAGAPQGYPCGCQKGARR